MEKKAKRLLIFDRRKRDRRKRLDPRFRNPKYEEFIDRRQACDRRSCCDYGPECLHSKHEDRTKSKNFIGLIALGLIIIVVVIGLLHLHGGRFGFPGLPK